MTKRFLLLLSTSLLSVSSIMGFVTVLPTRPSSSNPLLHAFASSSVSSSSSNNNKKKAKKTIQDRTPQEWQTLVQSIVEAVVQAGPRAGPTRTIQATRALTQTLQEYLPSPLNQFRPAPFNTARAVRQLFERLGATYVKLGQFVASSPTLFPAEYVTEFQQCLDQTEALDYETKIKPILEQEYGGKAKLNQLFSSIDPKPLASASIAQVHKAVLRSDGTTVVLKVQKPGIDALLKADLGFLKIASELLEFVQPDWERTSLKNIGSDIQSSMLEELDFVKESQNVQEFRQFLQEQNLTSVATAPRVYPKYTTRKVLMMEYLDGVSLLDTDKMTEILQQQEEVLSLENTIVTALNVWTLSVQTMPWFHADVHAGNLLLLKDSGKVGFLDFGIVGRVSPKTFTAVSELSQALTVGNYTAMAVALSNMGATSETVNIDQFAKDLEQVTTKLLKVQPDITVDATSSDSSIGIGLEVDSDEITNLLLDLVQVTENNGLKLPREFGLLVKQSLYFDRYLKILAPGLDVMSAMSTSSTGEDNEEDALLLQGTSVNGNTNSASNKNAIIDV
mmetsp:Transcript_32732/g.48469  ORF Transcript_32732/g.48469 Transcript_32732/m.48469 type:complete len:562 (-) Transcript_32732:98-1783(-)|eukprot:CAMPEP_0194215942 /NCGR_PEP_ID=MMETSP0156-20130528/18081_1 /TAXON_ID=33649 /ORGANISM="Thalassionema nitzschioides, Strain L26-B" /LENGTH=561 /DNA_ID=CAMNT_0038944587 /DNA_START=173 /DNA_END=1858 /DNA_ORIENTATION=-